MQPVFINFTNHPSAIWCEGQRLAAEKYGTIIDIPFPVVNPKNNKKDVEELADALVEKIAQQEPRAVLCQGEFCLAHQVVKKLQERNILVLAACNERNVTQEKNEKKVIFEFVQFREY